MIFAAAGLMLVRLRKLAKLVGFIGYTLVILARDNYLCQYTQNCVEHVGVEERLFWNLKHLLCIAIICNG
jgi:hypothetical protein